MKVFGKASLSALGMTMALQGNAMAVDFQKDVWPILSSTCLKCHGPDYVDSRGKTKSAKGELRIDNKEMLLKGGENGKAVVPGNPEKSPMYKSTVLPEGHDDIMPPKGDPLSKAQTDVIKKWIEGGADFGAWTAATKAEIDKAQSSK